MKKKTNYMPLLINGGIFAVFLFVGTQFNAVIMEDPTSPKALIIIGFGILMLVLGILMMVMNAKKKKGQNVEKPLQTIMTLFILAIVLMLLYLLIA